MNFLLNVLTAASVLVVSLGLCALVGWIVLFTLGDHDRGFGPSLATGLGVVCCSVGTIVILDVIGNTIRLAIR